MARQTIDLLTQEVLEIANGPEKQASAVIELKTAIGSSLQKLAAELRTSDPAAITYSDLADFRSRYANK